MEKYLVLNIFKVLSGNGLYELKII